MHFACVRCKLRMGFCSSVTKVVRYHYQTYFRFLCIQTTSRSLTLNPPINFTRADYYWWEIVAFLRKLAIAAVRLLHNPLDQVISVAAILLVNIAATAQCDPYEEQYLDYMELVALSCNLMILSFW